MNVVVELPLIKKSCIASTLSHAENAPDSAKTVCVIDNGTALCRTM